ncbi:MAG: molybdenum ABC transporter ATP-binding protein [Xanthomonadales bacterium]|nr:molybdenum ABC transporter ATP-binding protein [Xanthomonadales bacterium]NIN59068.1 molybdenum ABC transporter ATP-binding protein [Xanthomonadales bacterium]NIN74372.1 molybdenum ABC transporter ATP-binding protein [Xanthomonadales bacterium]NIO13177.1 molybdenum ABC transporter ATP-binding protein [Xanthomonadales bacterium]NIP11461.1 molybdenum ABC transporter ATP-binding protein [Xanthomonadales bacterium]
MSIRARFQVARGAFRLDVDLQLPAAGVTALFGPSGCGKTTLLRAIAGLDRIAGGFLEVDGEAWQEGERFRPPHRRPLGYVFQEASLFEHLDVRGNLEYGRKRSPDGASTASLAETVDLLGIAQLLERDPRTLSGGERQRVAIARALAVGPQVLLMDEPLAALELERRREILPYLEALHRNLRIPVIYVSHVPDEVARLADHVVLLEAGAVRASGSVQEVFSRLDLPLAHDHDAAAIVEAQVSGHDAEFHLTLLEFAGGRLTMAREDLSPGSRVRLRIAARDVSLAVERASGTSILNILPATVDAIEATDAAQATVRLLAGGVPLLARVTRKSVARLGLEPGQAVFAQAKSIALLS